MGMEKKKKENQQPGTRSTFPEQCPWQGAAEGLLQLQPLLRTRPTCTGSPRRQDGVGTQGLEQ